MTFFAISIHHSKQIDSFLIHEPNVIKKLVLILLFKKFGILSTYTFGKISQIFNRFRILYGKCLVLFLINGLLFLRVYSQREGELPDQILHEFMEHRFKYIFIAIKFKLIFIFQNIIFKIYGRWKTLPDILLIFDFF